MKQQIKIAKGRRSSSPFASIEGAANTVIQTIQLGIPVARIEIIDEAQLRVVNAYSNPDHPDTHADTAPNATDGSTATYWYTQTYGNQTFGGLLTGLGLVLDAGGPVKLAHVTVTTPTPGFTAEIQSGDSQSGPFVADSPSQTVDSTTTFTLNGNTAQYYVVWITLLPPELYAKISEVTATS